MRWLSWKKFPFTKFFLLCPPRYRIVPEKLPFCAAYQREAKPSLSLLFFPLTPFLGGVRSSLQNLASASSFLFSPNSYFSCLMQKLCCASTELPSLMLFCLQSTLRSLSKEILFLFPFSWDKTISIFSSSVPCVLFAILFFFFFFNSKFCAGKKPKWEEYVLFANFTLKAYFFFPFPNLNTIDSISFSCSRHWH